MADLEHGLRGYRRGCRCDVCRDAQSILNRQRYQQNRVLRFKEGAVCDVGECELHVYSVKSGRNLCQHHHVSWRRFGTVDSSRELMFNALADRSDSDGCHLWTGGKYYSGYGAFQSHCAHRWAYQFAYGAIPDGMDIDHRCHVKACVNPAHLRVVTRKQNLEHRQPSGHGKSGIRGVDCIDGRWRARVRHNGQDHHVGQFDTADEAQEAARLKRLELFTHSDLDRLAVTSSP